MRIIKRIGIALLALIVLAAVVGMIIVHRVKKSGMPQYEGQLTIHGLNEPVKVIRDERGMPHIYAKNEHDLYYAVGYVEAQERLWQMDLVRRVTLGRLSEIFGKDYVNTDVFLRSLQMTKKSEMVRSHLSDSVLTATQSFVDGVNQFITDAGKNLPPEFKILGYQPEPWSIIHTLNIIGYMGWDLARDNLRGDLAIYRLFTKYGHQKALKLIPYFKYTDTPIYPDFKLSDSQLQAMNHFTDPIDQVENLGVSAFYGSNNWVVNGQRSETGKPLLSNDMHLGFGSPGIWMQMHQVIEGKLNVTGVVVPGQPYVIAGHNQNVAWGMTNLMVDDLDLFSETVDSVNQTYLLDGQWNPLRIEKEVIDIKGGGKKEVHIRYTHRGPIITDSDKVDSLNLSMKWSGYDLSDEISAVYKLDRAANWNEFCDALRGFRSVSQNFAYADVNGNIGLHTGGGIPIRDGYGFMIRRGDSSVYDWKGYVPFKELPFTFNPANGAVSSANDKTVTDDYPYYIATFFASPYRINRIRQMLAQKEKFSTTDFQRMVTDRHSNYAAQLVPVILPAAEKCTSQKPAYQQAYQLLKDWNFDMTPNDQASVIFEYFTENLKNKLWNTSDEKESEQVNKYVNNYLIQRLIIKHDSTFYNVLPDTGIEETDSILTATFKQTIDQLVNLYGSDLKQWRWGTIHQFVEEHPLGKVKLLDKLFHFNKGTYPVGGSWHTVSPYAYEKGFHIIHGASERHIFNTSNWDSSYTVIPTGISGVPASVFYCSQTQTYVNDGFYHDWFSETAVSQAAKYTLMLLPEK